MIALATALILSFTPPAGQLIQIRIEREVSEVGRQEIKVQTWAEGAELPCKCRYPTPRTETHEIVSTSSDPHTIEITADHDPTAVKVSVWVIPQLHCSGNTLSWEGHGNQLYTVEKTTDMQTWVQAHPNRSEEPGGGSMRVQAGGMKAFRLKVTR